MNKKIICIFGTRPEAIKLAPVINELINRGFEVINVSTGQHTDMFEQVCQLFDLDISYKISLPDGVRSLSQTTVGILAGLEPILLKEKPHLTMVHGDTTTTLCGALASFYSKVPVVHVEAGLRSENIYSPWPEEINRILTSSLAYFHFAPTESAKLNLLKMGIPSHTISVCGNTVVDALNSSLELINSNVSKRKELESFFNFDLSKKVLMVTIHRRENHGKALVNVCDALIKLNNREDVQIIIPVHPHPHVKDIITSKLFNCENIHLLKPLNYLQMIFLMFKSDLILSDSGGIQEEAPSLNKYVMVLRDTTERQEALDAGFSRLIGTETNDIVKYVSEYFSSNIDFNSNAEMVNPYGDGNAAKRIVTHIEEIL